jgi:hypothetical protein
VITQPKPLALGLFARRGAQDVREDALAHLRDGRSPTSPELPPVGIITMRNRMRPPACEQLIQCLRRAAGTP